MGAAGSVISHEEAKEYPQYKILGGESKYNELKDEQGNVALSSIQDPYLQYGGHYNDSDPKNTKDFKYLQFDELPAFTPQHRSLMSKVLTPELFEKLKDLKTSKGYTLSNVIMTGVVTPHLGVGATAGDEECWEIFKDLFYPIIKGWHGYDANVQKHPIDLDPSKLQFSAEQQELFQKYVISTRIRAARNISGFSLPPGTTDEDRASVENVLKQTFQGLSGELEGKYYSLSALSDEQRDFLLERGFLFQIPTSKNLLTGAGAARSWPMNRGIFHNDKQTALCWVNEEDHCRIISMELGGNIPSVFQRFCELSNAIKIQAEANNTKLMWNETLGFLGTCPSNLGTGLRASVMIRLPEFNKLMDSENKEDHELLDQVCSLYELQPRGSSGEHSAAIGAKFDISNKQRLGFSEVELVQKMIDGVTKVIKYEELLASGSMTPQQLREVMKKEKETRKLRLIFVGPPGCGKGTQAVTIRSEMDLQHLSTGDMLREAVQRQTELGKQAQIIMNEGKLVPDELVISLIAEAIGPDSSSNGGTGKNGFILDGFPRTEEQAKLLDAWLSQQSAVAIDGVINLMVEDELLIKRITGRLIHPSSGRSYNIYFNPPQQEGLDDITQEPLVKRSDDTEDKLKTRLEEFHSKTKPILDYYQTKVINIQANDEMESITMRIREAIATIKNSKK